MNETMLQALENVRSELMWHFMWDRIWAVGTFAVGVALGYLLREVQRR